VEVATAHIAEPFKPPQKLDSDSIFQGIDLEKLVESERKSNRRQRDTKDSTTQPRKFFRGAPSRQESSGTARHNGFSKKGRLRREDFQDKDRFKRTDRKG
jgi:hypothetical protein